MGGQCPGGGSEQENEHASAKKGTGSKRMSRNLVQSYGRNQMGDTGREASWECSLSLIAISSLKKKKTKTPQ